MSLGLNMMMCLPSSKESAILRHSFRPAQQTLINPAQHSAHSASCLETHSSHILHVTAWGASQTYLQTGCAG